MMALIRLDGGIMTDLWWLSIGVIALMVAQIMGAVQETEEQQGKLKRLAAWKHRVAVLASGFVAVGATGSLMVNLNNPWPWSSVILLGVTLMASFLAVGAVVWIQQRAAIKKKAAALKRKVWKVALSTAASTAVAIIIWFPAPKESEPASKESQLALKDSQAAPGQTT